MPSAAGEAAPSSITTSKPAAGPASCAARRLPGPSPTAPLPSDDAADVAAGEEGVGVALPPLAGCSADPELKGAAVRPRRRAADTSASTPTTLEGGGQAAWRMRVVWAGSCATASPATQLGGRPHALAASYHLIQAHVSCQACMYGRRGLVCATRSSLAAPSWPAAWSGRPRRRRRAAPRRRATRLV
jgi:hypothetical protein